MKLGNVIYVGDLVDHKKVEYIDYVSPPVDFTKFDPTLPTLFVGWFFMKQYSNDETIQQQSILDKKIVTNRFYWEFSFNENKGQHVEGVNYFVNNVPYYYFKPKYGYVNLDPIFFRISTIQDLNDALAKNYDALYNYKGNMLYLLNSEKNNQTRESIVGIDLNMYEHFEFNIDELLQTIYKKVPVNQIYNDFDGEIYQKHYKIYPNFDELKRYLVVLLSKE